MSSIYQTPEWREARDKFIKDQGGICQECRREDGEIIEILDRKNKPKFIKIRLAPHHIEKIELGLSMYNKIATKEYNNYFGGKGKNCPTEWDILKNKAIKEIGKYATQKQYSARMKQIWKKINVGQLKRIYQDYKSEAKLDYLNLTPETAVVTCQRCHYAHENGMALCQECKTYYFKINSKYKVCYRCSKKNGR